MITEFTMQAREVGRPTQGRLPAKNDNHSAVYMPGTPTRLIQGRLAAINYIRSALYITSRLKTCQPVVVASLTSAPGQA